MIVRLLSLTALLALAAAFALVLATPEVVGAGWGHPLAPGVVHLVTLGGIVSLAYLRQEALWRRLYGERAPWPPLLWAVWALHLPGVVLLAWGLARGDRLLALVGGHYLVPSGIVLALAHGLLAAWRRTPGAPRRLAAHLPGLGLAVAMSLGALLVMEAHRPRWGIYSVETILAHLLAGGFLFVLPQALLPRMLAAPPAPAGSEAELAGVAALLRWYAATAAGALGVLLVVLALAGQAPARTLPSGLALLGALLVWLGLPPGGRLGGTAGPRALARLLPLAGRLATGVLLFYAALRYARGALPGEGPWLAKVGVLLFLAGVAVPELLAPADSGSDDAPPLPQAVWLAGTALLLAGQLAAVPWLVQAGAGVWLAGLAVHARGALRAA